MSTHVPNKYLITQVFSATAISLSLLSFGTAHAEQYCKSIDKDGNATYTLAPEKGCNAKKMKTVAINHHITPSSAPKPSTPKTDAEAASTTATTAPPTAPAAPSAGATNAETPKPQQTPSK